MSPSQIRENDVICKLMFLTIKNIWSLIKELLPLISQLIIY